MKLYTSVGPNPQCVLHFAALKNIDLEKINVDLRGGENRQPDYLEVNPDGQLPALVLDDGSILTEITAICEYLDEITPGDSLIGNTPEERAQTRRWTRWADLNICVPMGNGFRFAEGLPMFKDRMRCLPEAADGLKACAQDKLAFLNEQMDGKDFIVSNKLTLADILLYSFLSFGANVGQPINPDHGNITAWFDRVKSQLT